MRCYKSFDELYIDQEIEDIINSNEVIHIKFNSKKKDMMFLLGILFAAGKKIQIDNINDLTIDDYKSFDKLAYYWHKNRCFAKVSNQNNPHKMFLICTDPKKDEARAEQIDTIIKNANKQDIGVYYPKKDTKSMEDNIGFDTCVATANAIGNSNIVGLIYDRESHGMMFEIGVAYYFEYTNNRRSFKLLNEQEIRFDEEDFGDRIILKMLRDQEQRSALKNINQQKLRIIN